jgi:hypothetical protein
VKDFSLISGCFARVGELYFVQDYFSVAVRVLFHIPAFLASENNTGTHLILIVSMSCIAFKIILRDCQMNPYYGLFNTLEDNKLLMRHS